MGMEINRAGFQPRVQKQQEVVKQNDEQKVKDAQVINDNGDKFVREIDEPDTPVASEQGWLSNAFHKIGDWFDQGGGILGPFLGGMFNFFGDTLDMLDNLLS